MRVITPSGSSQVVLPSGGTAQNHSASFETTINVTGNSGAAYATAITTSAGGSSLAAGFYIVSLMADVSGSTIPPASALLDYFEVQWIENGSPATTSVGSIGLDANLVSYDYTTPPVVIDTNSDVEWRYSISGWTSGACVLKLRVQLTRLC